MPNKNDVAKRLGPDLDLSPKKTSPKNGGKKRPKQNQNAIRSEIIAIIIIAAAIMVLISLFMTDAGLIGRMVSALMLGTFGVGAFILPIFAMIYACVLLINRHEILATSNIVMGCGIFLLFISVAQMIAGPSRVNPYLVEEYPYIMGVWQYIGQAYTRGSAAGGGLLGSSLSRLFISLISEIGTYIVFITTLVILVIKLTGRSLFRLLQGGFFTAQREIKAGNERRKIRVEERRLEAEARDEEMAEEEHEVYVPVVRPKKLRNFVLEEGVAAPEIEMAEEPAKPAKPVDDSVGYDFEKELAKLDEIEFPPEEFTIDVKGIVEGYKPAAIQIEDIEKEVIGGAEVMQKVEAREEEPVAATREDEYVFPPVELLRENTYQPSLSSRAQILENSKKLEETLQSFGVAAKVVEVSKGPTVTRYELSPGSGVKVSKISGLADDLALNLAAAGIRIEAPIPGKSVVGIEIPNKDVQAVFLREVIDHDDFWASPSKLSFAIGKDIAGNIVIADIAKMPHLLIAGATGAGKSVCINTLIASIIYKATPDEVKLLMIDPKVVELSVYNGIPHLLIPVVTDPKKASGALAWGVREMDDRYNAFAETRVRDLKGFNKHLAAAGKPRMPQIVIIIDELADLMMTCGKEVEESICRLAQKARAAGIHLIIATQRPSVDVITGLIKANVPSRLAFAVSSGTDSRTILDMVGAEKLLGKGDMLFSPAGLSKPQRIQGSFISDKEVENLVNFVKQDGEVEYSDEMIEKITATPEIDEASADSDPLLDEAITFIVEREKASTSMLQRRFRIGYNRAARVMEELVARGMVGPEDGAKPRKVLMNQYQYREYLERKKSDARE